MSLKGMIKSIVGKMTDTHMYRYVPRGINFARDLATDLPTYSVDTIFDVGANVGQSAKVYLAEFPNSHIHCFEPASHTFQQIRDDLRGNERVDCYRLALGSSKGTGEIVLQGPSYMFFLLGQSTESPKNNTIPMESVDIITLDEFCHTRGINQIDFLKIDTEGGDLDVLKGAATMLREQKIDLVQVEAGMNPGNSRHVSFESLKAFCESYKYFLYGIYEQVGEWPSREPHLRRTNPIFMSQRMIELNAKSIGSNQ